LNGPHVLAADWAGPGLARPGYRVQSGVVNDYVVLLCYAGVLAGTARDTSAGARCGGALRISSTAAGRTQRV
jgi:hypothetical protein